MIYESQFIKIALQSLNRFNRDPGSSSRGSFDRAYWGWKQRDFPDASLQAAVTLVLGWARREEVTDRIVPWLVDYVDFVATIQHADGSFDQCYPYERTPGVFYDILPAFIAVHASNLLPANTQGKLEDVIIRGVDFALATDEVHGEIVNHLAAFASALMLHHRHFGDSRTRKQALGYLERIYHNYDKEEGWFQEYSGPDPGYQTRTLAFLTRAASLLDDEQLWAMCAGAARFVEIMMMPDDSLHPMLGVRSTGLIYPSGFARLAEHDPAFRPLAARVRSAWETGSVPLPSSLDFDNALRLGEDAMLASETNSADIRTEEKANWQPGDVSLPNAGIEIRRSRDLAVYLGWRLGGTIIVWEKDAAGAWHLIAEDAGYLIDGRPGDRWLTRQPGSGRLLEASPARLVVESRFLRSLHDELSPLRLLMLRVLNLTLLRSQWLADLFRTVVVRHLSGDRGELGIRLHREIELLAGRVTVLDHVQATATCPQRLATAPLIRCRRVSGTHMASARYYHPHDVTNIGPWTETVAASAANGFTEKRILRDQKNTETA